VEDEEDDEDDEEEEDEEDEDEDEDEEEVQALESPAENARIRKLLRLPGAEEENAFTRRPQSAPTTSADGPASLNDSQDTGRVFTVSLPVIQRPTTAKPGRMQKRAKATTVSRRRKLVPIRYRSRNGAAKSVPQSIKEVLGMYDDVTSLDAQMALYQFYQQQQQQQARDSPAEEKKQSPREKDEEAGAEAREEEWKARIEAVQHQRRAQVVSEFQRAARRSQKTIFTMGELAQGGKEAKRREQQSLAKTDRRPKEKKSLPS